VIAVRLRVPIASWRKGLAREYLESEALPPPATCYGALLSFVGEADRERHRGCRVTPGLVNEPKTSTVLRTLWRFKDSDIPGLKANARPDFQQLKVDSDVLVFLDGAEDRGTPTLEERVVDAFRHPDAVSRFGGWSLGESTHLINDAHLLEQGAPLPEGARIFLQADNGNLTLPCWTDHVGTRGTRHAVGCLTKLVCWPKAAQLPQVPLA